MSEGPYQRSFQDILERVSQPARLIGGESGAGPGFSGTPGRLRVVLGFPDTYEIGISNQALQILYHLAAQIADVEVERAYLPWVDVLDEMRAACIPLLTLETWSPVAQADVLALTLQHEFNYTNVLEMLDVAGVPLRAKDRTHGPLVVGGGPATANFAPVAPFFDALVVGDGEDVFPEILHLLTAAKREGSDRDRVRGLLAGIEGVYVPGVSTTVVRRVTAHLEGAPYPSSCLVPLTSGVHDRAWVEIMRGCSRGCRFCQAGMWYRPVRERSADEVLQMAAVQLEATGHQELALASLSTTDYSALREVLGRLVIDHPQVRVSLPSLRVDSAAVRLAHLASPTGPSLTLAPEAGSGRMRDIINKNVTEDDILAAADEVFRSGHTTLKLYFIIGLPLETNDDVLAIADLCLRIRERGRAALGSAASRLQLNISVNNFVPKPFTPFQWTGMADRATLRARQELLRARLRRPGIRVALHDVDKSFLEAVLARGGPETADVVEAAWQGGARFDSWTEQFSRKAWNGALDAAGLTAERVATTAIAAEASLPWDLVQGCVEKPFLWEEWERAERGETTPDCRWDACTDCGACRPGVAVELAAVRPEVAGEAGGEAGARVQPGRHARAGGHAQPGVEAQVSSAQRYLLTFSATGRVRFVGHLDKAEIFRRAVRRAGGRLALSAGLRPKPLLSLALPLPVGMEGERELCEFTLAHAAPADFLERLDGALPAGLHLVSGEPYEGRAAAARVVAGQYEVEVEDAGGAGALAEAVARFSSASSLTVEDRREEKVRMIDVKAYVAEIEVEPLGNIRYNLRFRVAMTPHGSVRPRLVVKALTGLGAPGLTIVASRRTRIELG